MLLPGSSLTKAWVSLVWSRYALPSLGSLWHLPVWSEVWSEVTKYCDFYVGEVCNDGPQCLRDGEHGIPDSRDDGQTGRSRLFSGGSHGQGTTCSVVCVQVKLLWNYSRCVFLIFGTGVQLGGRLDLCERGSSGARRSGLYQELSLWALRQGLPHPAHLWGTHT